MGNTQSDNIKRIISVQEAQNRISKEELNRIKDAY